MESNEKTKANILKAISILVDRYSGDYYQLNPRTTTDCPLCKIFYVNEVFCKNCPNSSFRELNKVGSEINDTFIGCVNRCEDFRSLNWQNDNNLLSEFWLRVGSYLNRKSEADILALTLQIEKRILTIAKEIEKKYQNSVTLEK